MRRTLFTLVCWLTLVSLAAQQEVSAASNKITGPNILSILTDDMGPHQVDAVGKTLSSHRYFYLTGDIETTITFTNDDTNGFVILDAILLL